MSGLLQGRKGIVLGVANNRSIAWACAQECAQHGAELYFNYLGDPQKERLTDLISNIPNAHMAPCDVQDDLQIESFFNEVKEKWGHIDFLIHSIAYSDKTGFRDGFSATTRENFRMTMDISAYSLVAVSRAAMPLMTNGGSIISMSYYGAEKVVPHYNMMGVAKAALEASTRYLAEDLGQYKIRVNSISAGPIRTLSSSAISGLREMLDATQESAPLRRNVTLEDVAKAAVFLVSDLSSGVTGEVMHVDAGYNIMGLFLPNRKRE